MFFINGWYLWFIPLIGIPILLNIWKKKRVKNVVFPYFSLLMHSKIKNLAQIKLMNILLLLLRMAFLISLLFFMARPVRVSSQAIDTVSDDVPVAFILDNSRSMSYSVEKISLFKKASDLIADALLGMNQSTPCAFITINPQGKLESIESFSNPEHLLTELRHTNILNYRFDIQKAIILAQNFFSRTKQSPKKLLIFTDNQKHNWDSFNAIQLADDINVHFVVPSNIYLGGAGWTGLRFPDRLIKAGEKGYVTGILENFGSDTLKNVVVRAYVDNVVIDEEIVTLSPHKRSDQTFFYHAKSAPGFQKARLTISSPDFQIDNDLFLVLPAYQTPAIFVLGEPSDTVFITSALQNYTAETEKLIELQDTDQKDRISSGIDTVLAVTHYTPDIQFDTWLKNKVADGISAIVFTPPLKINETDQPVTIVPADSSHPILLPYKVSGENAFSDITCAAADYTPFLPDISERKVILKATDGKPFMEELSVHKGIIFVLYTDASGECSNLVKTELFLPLIHRMIDYTIVRHHETPAYFNRFVGNNLLLEGDSSFSVKWETPDGASYTPESRFINGKYRIDTLPSQNTGYYTLSQDNRIKYLISYNIPFYEGNMTPISHEEVKKMILSHSIFYTDLDAQAETPLKTKGTLAPLLIILCIVFSLVELAVANISG